MPTSIAALTPADHAFGREPGDEVAPGVPDVAFNELWQDGKEGLSFGDLIDIVNPLQHIPVVSTIYRMITGDEIGVGARIAGGALYGGPLGVLGAGMVAAFENISGDTVEKQVASLWNDITGDDDAASQIASAAPASAPVTKSQPQAAAITAPLAVDDDVAIETPVVAGAQLASVTAPPAPIAPPPPPPVPAVVASTVTPAADNEKKIPPPPGNDVADERRRIAQSIELAQRAQAGLLLANLAAGRPINASGDDKERDGFSEKTGSQQPFQPHPYLLPPGAPPEAVNKAMAHALDRYQTILSQRNASTTAASPRAIPVLAQ